MKQNSRSQANSTEESPTNRWHQVEKRLSGLKDKGEKMDNLVKENVNVNKQTKNNSGVDHDGNFGLLYLKTRKTKKKL